MRRQEVLKRGIELVANAVAEMERLPIERHGNGKRENEHGRGASRQISLHRLRVDRGDRVRTDFEARKQRLTETIVASVTGSCISAQMW